MTNQVQIPKDHWEEIIRYACKAPSGHNTQPWIFRITPESMTILPDFKAALPMVDPDHRELYISLGCAAENACLAASHLGYTSRIACRDARGITIQLTTETDKMGNRLFSGIEKRQTNRSIYSDKKITEKTLNALSRVSPENQVQCHFYETGSSGAELLAQYILRGNDIQMKDEEFKGELTSWMRFNEKQIREKRDGLTYKVFGNPPLPGWIAKTIVSLFLHPGQQNKSDQKKIASSSHLVLFTISANIPEQWIDLGRSLQRLLLQMTLSGIAHAYMNQPCEIPALAREIQEQLPIRHEFPVLILRIGYASPMPFSPRKEGIIKWE